MSNRKIDFRGTRMPLGIRNNNPGNIRPGDPWKGAVGENKGFVVFESIDYGIRALTMDLMNKILGGLDTIEKIINKYAPPIENSTKDYIKSVARTTGIKKDAVLSINRTVIKRLVFAVICHENGISNADKATPFDDLDIGMSMIPAKLLKLLK